MTRAEQLARRPVVAPWVIAQLDGVAKGRALLGLAVGLTHRESRSTVISAASGAAPADHALPKASSWARPSWRMCPKVNDRRNVPSVDGANGTNGRTPAAEPDRSRSASPMNEPPTSIDATNVSALRPDPEPADPPGAPPPRPAPPNSAAASASPPATAPHRPPATSHQTPAPTHRSHQVCSPQEVPPRMARMTRYLKQHSPMSGCLSGGRANPSSLTTSVDPGLGTLSRFKGYSSSSTVTTRAPCCCVATSSSASRRRIASHHSDSLTFVAARNQSTNS